MKIYTEIVYQFDELGNMHKVSDQSLDYEGPVTELKGGGGGGGTTIQKTEPPAYLQPYLTEAANEASGLYRQGPSQYYPGSTIAPQSFETQRAMDLMSQRALSGNSLTNQAQDQVGRTLRGDYLYGGSGFNAALDAANAAVLPNIQSAFSRAGRSGSGLAQTSIADAVSRNFANLYGQERQNQIGAAQYAPGIDYADLNQLSQVGTTRDQYSQDLLNEQIQRFNFNQDAGWQNLARYSALINGGQPGSTTTTQTPMYQNRAAGVLGGAATGAGIASALKLGGPWGWGLAGVGALTGLL